MKKTRLVVFIMLALLISVLLLSRVQAATDFFSEIRQIIQVYQIIQNEYIEKVPSSKLIDGAIQGMIQTLDDPHSRWLDAEEWKEWNIEKEGKFGGLGMAVGIREGNITIVEPFDDTPASRAGLKSGDKIIKIHDVSTEGMSLSEAVSKLRGKIGTEVTFTVERSGIPVPLEYTLTRELIKVPNIKTMLLANNIGYIQIMGFTSEHTSSDLRNALTSLQEQEMASLILDLRDNPGGLLTQAIEVADEFLASGIIVSIQGRDTIGSDVYYAKPEGKGINFPLIILINEGSASASEIVAGAIKDHQVGILMGTSTLGKGTVQNAIQLENGGAIWLTTAKYYTPSGKSIESGGIKPTVEVKPFIPTAEQIETMEKLRNSATIEEFLTLNPQWEKDDLTTLLAMLEENESIKVSAEILKRVLREKDEDKENIIFNDYQLVQALNLLNSLPILQQSISNEATP